MNGIFFWLNKLKLKRCSDNSKKSASLNNWKEDMEIVWQGRPRKIEFTYEKFNGESSRRKIDVEQILRNRRGGIYLHGFCQLRKAGRTFNIRNITTKILDGGGSYETEEWLASILKDRRILTTVEKKSNRQKNHSEGI